MPPPNLPQKHVQQLPLVRYGLIAFVGCGFAGFGLMGVAESWKQIESGHVVADDFIMLAMGLVFTFSAVPILKNLGLEIRRDLLNRFADEIAALNTLRQRQTIPQDASTWLTGAIAVGYGLALALPLCIALLAMQHDEAVGDSLTVAATALVCLLAPTITLHAAGASRLVVRWVGCTLLGVFAVFWFVFVLGMATDQLSLVRTDPVEISLVSAGLFVLGTVMAAICGLRKIYVTAHKELRANHAHSADTRSSGASS